VSTKGKRKEGELSPSASTPIRLFELEDHGGLDSPQDQGMLTDRALLRMGAVSIVLGTLISNVAGFFHGGGSHPENLAATLPVYAANANWEVVHLAQFVGDALLLVGFLALYRSIIAVAGTGASAALARMGFVIAVVAEGVYAVNQSVDGIANKFVAQQWVSAAPDEKAVAFRVADAVRHIEIGTSSLWVFNTGLALLFFGLAIALGRAYSRLLGWAAIAIGVGLFANALNLAYDGFSFGSPLGMVGLAASFLLTLWILILAFFTWRKAGNSGRHVRPQPWLRP
jgi:hypothetical protein